MRNKARFEYVDEFRKINCLQKLIPIENLFPDDEEDGKQDNNKFIRYKDEANLEHLNRNQDYLFNQIITGYMVDIQPQCNDRFDNNKNKITKDITYYQNWSETLNQEIKVRDYRHRFYFKDANPPPRLKQQTGNKDKPVSGDTLTENNNENNQDDDANIQLPQRGKYNFYEITKHLYAHNSDKEDKDNSFLRDLSVKNEIAEFRKLKNLDQIQKVGEFYEEYTKFNYYIEPHQQQCDIEFVDNSIVRGNNSITIDYFRDIGTPSRNILDFTLNNYNKMKIKDEDDDIQNDYKQEKRELLYLYFLREEELKINKGEMTFYDIANLSMGRITANNAHMCIRNEKVTAAQYAKLLKKMEKYDLRQNEAGKPKNDKLIGTEELEDMNLPTIGEQQHVQLQNTNIEKIIEEVNKIRKEVKFLEENSSNNLFNRPNFNQEVYVKLEGLLNILYELVTEKMAVKYSLNQISKHLHEIQGTNELGFDRLRILWFVANCYEEMLNKQNKKVDIRNISSKQAGNNPQIIKYKGNKVIAQQTIQPKKVYGFTVRQGDQKTNKSKSPRVLAKTPVKSTPVKSKLNNSTIANRGLISSNSKLSNINTTAKKQPQTAKK